MCNIFDLSWLHVDSSVIKFNVDIIHYIQYGPVVSSNRQTLMKRVVEQNQTDVVRLQEKSINPVQK